jgi:quinol-cytochrome oxidoreductase complex cytochrome b subunit
VSALPPIAIDESNDPLATPRRVALVRPDTRPAVRRREETYVMTFPHLVVREIILFQVVTIALSIAALLFDAPLQGIANPTETPNPAKAPWYFLGLQELLHYFPPVVAGVLLPGLVVVALVVIPYARVNLSAGPLWARRGPRMLAGIMTAVVGVTAFAALFHCWPVAVPTIAVGLVMLSARGGERGGRIRLTLAEVTLPEWIMTWFVIVASVLTIIGTFFRGPGWSFVWPWASFRSW